MTYRVPTLTVAFPAWDDPGEMRSWTESMYGYLTSVDKWARSIQGRSTGAWSDEGAYVKPRTDGDYARVYNSAGTSFSELQDLQLAFGGVGSSNVGLFASGTGLSVKLGDGTAGATISCPTSAPGAEIFGSGASAGFDDGLAVGADSNASGTRATALGHGATAAQDCVAIGRDVNAASSGTIAIGVGATAAASNTCVVGNSATASAAFGSAFGVFAIADLRGTGLGYQCHAEDDSVAIGYQAGGSGRSSSVAIGRSAVLSGNFAVSLGREATANLRDIAIGYQADAGTTNVAADCVAIGYQATTTAANQVVVGSGGSSLSTFILGSKGDTHATPAAVTWRNTNASGTDVAAANLTISAGRGTGTGAGGHILMQTAPAGTTGSSLNALVTRFEIQDVGDIDLTPASGQYVRIHGSNNLRGVGGLNLDVANSTEIITIASGLGNAVIQIDDTGAADRLGFFAIGPVARQAALTAKNAGVVNSGDATTDAVIDNNRTRIEEIETRLQAYGLIQ